MTTAVKNVLRLAEQERRLANEVLRQRGIDNPTLERLEAACEVAGATIGGDTDRAAEITVGGYGYSREELRRTSIAATQERDRKAGNAHGLGTVDGVEYNVNANWPRSTRRRSKLLRRDGKGTWSEQEYFAAAVPAAEILGIDRSRGRAE